jgi:hypothetical protein
MKLQLFSGNSRRNSQKFLWGVFLMFALSVTPSSCPFAAFLSLATPPEVGPSLGQDSRPSKYRKLGPLPLQVNPTASDAQNHDPFLLKMSKT